MTSELETAFEKLALYINENTSTGLADPNNPDALLGIDSLGVIRLVAFIDSELGIYIEDDDLQARNFVSLQTVRELLTRSIQNKSPEVPLENVG